MSSATASATAAAVAIESMTPQSEQQWRTQGERDFRPLLD